MSNLLRTSLSTALVAIPISVAQVSDVNAQDLNSFAVIAGSTVTNTGATTIDGNIAISPGISYTGSGSVTQTNGTTYIGDAVAGRIQNDLTTLYNALAGRQTTQDLTSQDLGGKTLTAGVYNFNDSAQLTGTLTLDAEGDPDAIFIFNIGSTLTTASDSNVSLINGAYAGNVFYVVGSSATVGTGSMLEGQIVALTSITMTTGATLDCGAAWARNGAVTLDTNTIKICTLASRGFDAVVDSPVLSENEKDVAKALSDYVDDGGELPFGLAVLAATQGPAELAATLAQLSGEVGTGVAPTGMQSMDAFLDAVMGSRPNSPLRVTTPPEPAVPVGMVPNRERTEGYGTGKYGAAEPVPSAPTLVFSPTLAEQPRQWDIWASGYGSRNVVDGDTSIGSQERTSNNHGLAFGLNFSPSDGKDFGIALSWNEADFTLSNGFGHGTSDTVFAALRGRTSTDLGYLEGAIAYGRSDITTDRTVTIAGVDRLVGETTADNFAAHVEAGYHMGNFTPFVGLRAQSFTTAAYSETAASGSSSYALRYDENTTTSLRSELGVDMQWTPESVGGGVTTFGLRAAWAHEFASNEPGTRSFLSVPDAVFSTSGATQDRDSVILAANAGMAASNGLYVDAALNMEFSENSQDLGGALTVGYRW